MVNCCTAVTKNMIPMITPVVVTEAWSNCRITSETISQPIPKASQSHQKRAMPLTTSRAAASAGVPASTVATVRGAWDGNSALSLALAYEELPDLAVVVHELDVEA